MRSASLGWTARLVAVAMMLAAGVTFAAGRADASAGHLAAVGLPRSAGATWGKAIEVPGIGALNTGSSATTYSVSCATAGNCSAGGYYTEASFHTQAFVVNETGGKWGTGIEVPGIAALDAGGAGASLNSVSCGSAGNCSAGGDYRNASAGQAFVVTETGGKWGTAVDVPGLAALNTEEYAGINSVSCATAGNCSAGGFYTNATTGQQAFVVSETS
jgi:hypothetical protein